MQHLKKTPSKEAAEANKKEAKGILDAACETDSDKRSEIEDLERVSHTGSEPVGTVGAGGSFFGKNGTPLDDAPTPEILGISPTILDAMNPMDAMGGGFGPALFMAQGLTVEFDFRVVHFFIRFIFGFQN